MPEFFFYRMAEKTRMRINGESGKREVGDVCVSSSHHGREEDMAKWWNMPPFTSVGGEYMEKSMQIFWLPMEKRVQSTASVAYGVLVNGE